MNREAVESLDKETLIRLVLSQAATIAAQSRPQESGQDDKWSFCLTVGTLCPVNQEIP